ncbi:MAG: ABC transporter substrate-binding protein, partial [Clostridia bacterium]|nr:ABC transporter substrate-binding protein [Clostridia bacterium]
HNQKKADAPVVFGQLTQKDGAFLVSRTENASFSVNDLKNKEILAGRKGGVPAMSFEYMLKNSGLTENDYTLNFDVQFNMMTSAFISGIADYCTVFEPTASEYEKQGKWHVVASVGELTGEIPYTSFIALESFINNNSETLKSFMKALKKAYDFMSKSSDLEIAQSILKQFPSTSVESIETSVKNYRKIDAWKTDMQATESSFDNLQNVMESAGELTSRVAFNKIVNNTIAKEIFG